jgi:heptosyltransferase-2
VKYSRVEKLNLEKFLLAKLKIDVMPDEHFVKRCFDAALPLGVKDDGFGLDFFIGESDRVREADLPLSHQAGYIALVIGATYITKKLPDEKLIDLVNTIRHPVVLLGGPGDTASGEKVSASDPVKVYNACGKFSLGESADLVRKSKLVITHDTGLMHIAAAFQKDIISVWGNTDSRFGMYPYYGTSTSARSVIFERKLWCRPCSKLGYKKCPLFHFNCMQKQDTEEMARITHQLLGILH